MSRKDVFSTPFTVEDLPSDYFKKSPIKNSLKDKSVEDFSWWYNYLRENAEKIVKKERDFDKLKEIEKLRKELEKEKKLNYQFAVLIEKYTSTILELKSELDYLKYRKNGK